VCKTVASSEFISAAAATAVGINLVLSRMCVCVCVWLCGCVSGGWWRMGTVGRGDEEEEEGGIPKLEYSSFVTGAAPSVGGLRVEPKPRRGEHQVAQWRCHRKRIDFRFETPLSIDLDSRKMQWLRTQG
jgi:hypothetical protein